jgi:hypothetical protein
VITDIRSEALCPFREVAIVGCGKAMHVEREAAKGSFRGATPRSSYRRTSLANGSLEVTESRIRESGAAASQISITTCRCEAASYG